MYRACSPCGDEMTDWTEDAEQQGWDDELELYLATRKVPSDASELLGTGYRGGTEPLIRRGRPTVMTAQMKEKLREQQHVDSAIDASTILIGFYTNALEEATDQIKLYVDDGNFAAALGELKQVEETEIVGHLTELLMRRRELQERSDAL